MKKLRLPHKKKKKKGKAKWKLISLVIAACRIVIPRKFDQESCQSSLLSLKIYIQYGIFEQKSVQWQYTKH